MQMALQTEPVWNMKGVTRNCLGFRQRADAGERGQGVKLFRVRSRREVQMERKGQQRGGSRDAEWMYRMGIQRVMAGVMCK